MCLCSVFPSLHSARTMLLVFPCILHSAPPLLHVVSIMPPVPCVSTAPMGTPCGTSALNPYRIFIESGIGAPVGRKPPIRQLDIVIGGVLDALLCSRWFSPWPSQLMSPDAFGYYLLRFQSCGSGIRFNAPCGFFFSLHPHGLITLSLFSALPDINPCIFVR